MNPALLEIPQNDAPAMRMPWIDRAIATVAPRMALRRMRARHSLEVVRRQAPVLEGMRAAYEGAALSRLTKHWLAPDTDANAVIDGDLGRLRARCRDLVRNNPHAPKALSAITTNVLGRGLTPSFDGPGADLAEELFGEWIDAPIDVEGQHSFASFQRIMLRSLVEGGECLVRRQRARKGPTVRLRLQPLEGDYIDTLETKVLDNGHNVVMGVEFDSAGRRVAYWLYPEHPGTHHSQIKSGYPVSKRYPVENVRSAFRCDRAGQVRGVPWLSPVILTTKALDDYRETKLFREKIAACFAGFLYMDTDDDPEADPKSPIPTKLEPGMIPRLPRGWDIKFAVPPVPNGDDRFVSDTLHSIAAGIGITYEALTGDWSGVNYSSGRMGWIEMGRNVVDWRQMFTRQVLSPVWSWFTEAAAIEGANLSGVKVRWSEPRREMLDPVKEGAATRDQIRAGLMSLSDAIRESGRDPKVVLEQLAKDLEEARALGLSLDVDGTVFQQNGLTPVPEDEPETKEEGTDAKRNGHAIFARSF